MKFHCHCCGEFEVLDPILVKHDDGTITAVTGCSNCYEDELIVFTGYASFKELAEAQNAPQYRCLDRQRGEK